MIIGEARSECSIAISMQTNHSMIPQISYASTSPLLSDKTKYPYFFRTCPSDVHQANALSELVTEHDWQTVGTIAVKDKYSMELIRRTEKELIADDVELAAQERMTPRKFEDVAEHLGEVRVMRVLALLPSGCPIDLFNTLVAKLNITCKHYHA